MILILTERVCLRGSRSMKAFLSFHGFRSMVKTFFGITGSVKLFPHPKPTRRKDDDLLRWIRTLPCVLCGGFNNSGKNEASHIKTRGSGGEDLYNVLPMNSDCHRFFETRSHETKEKFKPLAKIYTEWFLEGVENPPVVTNARDLLYDAERN